MFLVDIFFISLISFKVEYRKVTLTPFRCNTILLKIDVMAKATPLSGAIIPKIFSNVFSIYSFFEINITTRVCLESNRRNSWNSLVYYYHQNLSQYPPLLSSCSPCPGQNPFTLDCLTAKLMAVINVMRAPIWQSLRNTDYISAPGGAAIWFNILVSKKKIHFVLLKGSAPKSKEKSNPLLFNSFR
jgi:hypothetical protein